MKITERGQITIPKAIREKCGLTPNLEVEVRIKDGAVVVEPKRDGKKFDAAIKRWRGSLRKEMLADGYASTRELMKDLRGR
jgi:antitoxin PrlF